MYNCLYQGLKTYEWEELNEGPNVNSCGKRVSVGRSEGAGLILPSPISATLYVINQRDFLFCPE